MVYGLSSCHFTIRQIRKIQGRATSTSLSKMGYNSCTSRDIDFCPVQGGFGLRDLSTDMGIAQVTALLQHIRTASKLGALMLIHPEWVQLVSGYAHQVTMKPHMDLQHTDGTEWLLSALSFLARATHRVYINNFNHLRPQREGGYSSYGGIQDAAHLPRTTQTAQQSKIIPQSLLSIGHLQSWRD